MATFEIEMGSAAPTDELVDAVLSDVVPAIERLGDVGSAVLHNTIVVSAWGAKWMRYAFNSWRVGGPVGEFAADVLKDINEVEDEPVDFIEEHVVEHRKVVKDVDGVRTIFDNKKVSKRLRKGRRSHFAAAVAKVAYLKFGNRQMSEANMLVTRRWIAKYLEGEEFKDLRTCDKAIAIDRALFLSFVPTREFGMMKMVTATKQWEDRVVKNDSFPGFWSRVFGVGRFPDTEDFSH